MDKITKYIVLGVFILLVGIGVYTYFHIKSLNNKVAHWVNEASKKQELIEVKDGLYEKMLIVNSDIIVSNEVLKGQIDLTKRNILLYQKLIMKYEYIIGNISTTSTKDTVSVPVDPLYPPGPDDRQFSKSVDIVDIAGYFQTRDPFDIYITRLELSPAFDIIVSQAKDKTWFWNLTSNSAYLNPTHVNVQISPIETGWEFFAGTSLYFKDFKPSDISGIDAFVGLRKNSFGATLGSFYDENGKLHGKIGFMRYF